LQAVALHVFLVDLDRTTQHVARRHLHLACLAQQTAQGDSRFLDQHQAQLIGVAKVTIEGVRYDAGFARDFAQSKAGEAASRAHQGQRRLQETGARQIFARAARQGLGIPGGTFSEWLGSVHGLPF
jgi:hypothetical protein